MAAETVKTSDGPNIGDASEDWDNDTVAPTTAVTSTMGTEEDWDSEITDPKSSTSAATGKKAVGGDGGEDWDAEIQASEDWDSEAKGSDDKKQSDQGPVIASSEDWDSEVKSVNDWDSVTGQVSSVTDSAPATGGSSAADHASDLAITGTEDWDDQRDGLAVSSSDADTTVISGKGSSLPPAAKPPSTNWEEDKKRVNTVKKIRDALNFMRNQQFEVPFIAFYRKEYVEPELNINDLWKVYTWDERWCQLRTRKENLLRLFQKMQEFQCDEIMREPDRPLPEDVRILADEDFERLRGVQTFEELKDVYSHFDLYYGGDVPRMREAMRLKRQAEREQNQRRRKNLNEGDDVEEPEEKDELDVVEEERVKQATRLDAYTYCRKARLGEYRLQFKNTKFILIPMRYKSCFLVIDAGGLAKRFGLSPQQFGENLRDNYQRHEVEQYPIAPGEVAQEYVSQ